uniref:Ubiq_cyt_C_chap domain-containing protein n=1 Tax=Parastrongyloides trichosuri TaxID=131310 RepID=A0A0N4ZJ96_PARTI
MNLFTRRLLSVNGVRSLSNTYLNANVPVKKENYQPLSIEEYAELEVLKKPSKIPFGVMRLINSIKSHVVKNKTLDSETKMLLDKSASQLYFNCANNFPFIILQEKFGLPDTVASWYKLTLMHVWMILMRLHVTMDMYAYERVRSSLLSAMWHDIDTRLDLISKEVNEKLTTKGDMKKMHGLYIQTLLEYDEGFLKNDTDLAGAIWRNLYTSKENIDPILLCNAIKYMRGTVAYLNTIETGELLVNGVPHWKQLEGQLKIE